MRIRLLPVCLAFIAIACNSKDKETPAIPAGSKKPVATDPLLITDSSWGAITKTADFKTLVSLYGATNVKDDRICGPECIDSLDVTLLYPNQPNESIIYWKDSAYHKTIAFIECRGGNAGFHTAAGIKNGSGLSELLKLNGRRIDFYGFGWDYGGAITSFNKGALETGNIRYELILQGDGADGLWGDIPLHTDMPVVKQHLDSMRVSELFLSFDKPTE
jgi:hypothetical protein